MSLADLMYINVALLAGAISAGILNDIGFTSLAPYTLIGYPVVAVVITFYNKLYGYDD